MLGEHTESVLAELLGVTKDEARKLKEKGAV
jgi:crotonobetainyl-CoA:carnitine CoA-transferase CaiB-like acyl-CoA transferase